IVAVLKDIEDHLDFIWIFPLPFPNRLEGDFRGQFIWEMKLAGGDTAESDACKAVFHRQFQAGTIAVRQQLSVRFRYCAINDRANGMQHITAGEVVPFCNFRVTGLFLTSLPPHNLSALQTELNP